MSDEDPIKCPVCGSESEKNLIEQHPKRAWGGTGKFLPAGETFSCANDVECGLYVEVNRQGVLWKLLEGVL